MSLPPSAAATRAHGDDSSDHSNQEEEPPAAKRAKRTTNDDDDDDGDNNPTGSAEDDGSCIRWTNPEELAFVLRLGDLWNCQIPLRISMIQSPGTTAITEVTITPVKREDWDAIEENVGEIDEEEEVFYGSEEEDGDGDDLADKYLEYFRSFYHMNQERGQSKIFGHSWRGTVLHSIRDLLKRLEQRGREAVFYVSDLPICDEFNCDGEGPLVGVVRLLRNLIYQKHWVTQNIYGGTDYQNQQVEKPILSFDNLLLVEEGSKVQVSGSRDVFHVQGLASEQELQELVNVLHPPNNQNPLLQSIVGPSGPHSVGRYLTQCPHSHVFGGDRAAANSPALSRLYQKLACCSHAYQCQRTRDLVKETGIVAVNEIQAFLYDYLGEFQAIVFSACDVGCDADQPPSPQAFEFRQPSWSVVQECSSKGKKSQNADDAAGASSAAAAATTTKTLTATVTQLRDAGILDCESNDLVLRRRRSDGDSRRQLVVLLEEEEGQSMYKAIDFDQSKVTINGLPANGVVG